MKYRTDIWSLDYNRWEQHSIEENLHFVKMEFIRLTKCGYILRVQECRDMNRGDDWLG